MKKIIFTIAIAAVVAVASFTSCNSSEEKVSNAEIKVEDAKQNLKEVIKDSAVVAEKAANAEEWKMFKNVAEVTIKNNEIKIADLKNKMKKAGVTADIVYAHKIENLEQQNHNLKVKIDNYDKQHSDWEAFKSEFNKDVDNLGQAIKDIASSTKK